MEKPSRREEKPRPATAQEAADLQARLIGLNERANAGDAGALAELKAFLDAHPVIWQTVGDVSRISVTRWTELLAGKDVLLRESIARFVADWKAQLVGPDASPTERALADTAAAARLALAHAEWLAPAASEPMKSAEFAAKRLDTATRRFHATLRLLIQVRSASPTGLVSASPAAGMPRLYVAPAKRKKAG